VAFEVFDFGTPNTRYLFPLAKRFEEAFSKAKELAYPVTLKAIAWFDEPLQKCPDGSERLVCRYFIDRNCWSAWTAEERIGCSADRKAYARDRAGYRRLFASALESLQDAVQSEAGWQSS
jgi:hypothetical protein